MPTASYEYAYSLAMGRYGSWKRASACNFCAWNFASSQRQIDDFQDVTGQILKVINLALFLDDFQDVAGDILPYLSHRRRLHENRKSWLDDSWKYHKFPGRCARHHADFRCAHACISKESDTVIEMGTISTVLDLDTRILNIPESYSTNNRFYQLIDQACTYR